MPTALSSTAAGMALSAAAMISSSTMAASRPRLASSLEPCARSGPAIAVMAKMTRKMGWMRLLMLSILCD
jgi:hypothetical protein